MISPWIFPRVCCATLVGYWRCGCSMFRSNLIRVWEGCIPPVNVHLRSLSVVSAGWETLFGSNQKWCNRLDLRGFKLGGGGLLGVGGAWCGSRRWHICRLKPPCINHITTSSLQNLISAKPKPQPLWRLGFAHLFTAVKLLLRFQFFTFTSSLPNFYFFTSFLLEFGFLDLNFLGLLRLKVPHYEDLQPQQVWISWISQCLLSDKVGWNNVVQDSL